MADQVELKLYGIENELLCRLTIDPAKGKVEIADRAMSPHLQPAENRLIEFACDAVKYGVESMAHYTRSVNLRAIGAVGRLTKRVVRLEKRLGIEAEKDKQKPDPRAVQCSQPTQSQ